MCSIQLYFIKYVIDLRQIHRSHWMPKIKTLTEKCLSSHNQLSSISMISKTYTNMLSFMIYHWVRHYSYMTDVTSNVVADYTSGQPEFGGVHGLFNVSSILQIISFYPFLLLDILLSVLRLTPLASLRFSDLIYI